MKAYDVEVDIKPFNCAVSIIGGKWKMQIIFWLWKYKTMRYSEIKRAINGIIHKMLSNKLKELEANGLVIRHDIPVFHQR